MLSAYADSAEQLEDVFRHSGRKVNGAVIIVDLNSADPGTVQPCFVGNGADDITGLDGVHVSYFEPKCFEVGIAPGRWTTAFRRSG